MNDAYDYAYAHHFVGMSYFNSGLNSPDGTWVMDAERMSVFKQYLSDPETARL
jgi:hypothetical protein